MKKILLVTIVSLFAANTYAAAPAADAAKAAPAKAEAVKTDAMKKHTAAPAKKTKSLKDDVKKTSETEKTAK